MQHFRGLLLPCYAPAMWATGNPCMSHSIELVQGLSRSSRMSYTPAAVPPVPLPSHCSGQQTLSVAAEPRSRGGGARPLLPLRPVKWFYLTTNHLSISSSDICGGGLC